MSMLPADYEERVYAGVLGKIIGVYLGRPFEGWLNEDIEQRLGEIDYYVHEKISLPLIVINDDISGTFTFIRALSDYGYDKYGGNCHMVPNHGLIVHALLHGEGDFQKSLMIVNTAGWDTDCNSGNLGCLLGIRNGIESINDGPDWRAPVADICYLPTADGGGGISDAATQARR